MVPRKPYKKKRTNYLKKKFNILKPKMVSTAVKSYVKKTLAHNIEHKTVSLQSGIIHMYFTNAALSTGQLFPLTPSGAGNGYTIPQGTGQGNRIGNHVRVTKAILKYWVSPAIYDSVFNNSPTPTDLEVYLFGLKPVTDSISNAQTIVANSFFQLGNSVEGIGSIISDLMAEPNKDQINLYSRHHYKLGNAGYTGSGNIAAQQYYLNNDYKLNIIHRQDITKHFPKSLIFNDTSSTTTSRGLYLYFNPLWANGVSPIASQLPLFFECQLDLTYEDA